MAIELIAPAKLNPVLEVTGRRQDGYHAIVSVMQTINLCDRVRVDIAPTIEIIVSGEKTLGVPREGPRNLAFRAAVALAAEAGRADLGARIELEKGVPAGLGLGGGSSDAAAVLRGLNRLWQLDLEPEALMSVAAGIGSDVPFFLAGGTALVEGRGERVEPLPDMEARAMSVFVADVEIEDKTRRMYAALTPADFSDGRRARVLARSIERGLPLSEADFGNAFDRHIGEVAPPLAGAMALCRDAGLGVFACGSGPGFFSPTPIDELPGLLHRELERDWGVKALPCITLAREAVLYLRET